jgi:hypothetical protein
MRIRHLTYSLALIVPLVIAACASTAGSPSPAATSSPAPSAVAGSPEPSASAQPSEAAATPDAWAEYRDGTLRPALDEITTALTQWEAAFAAAAAADASDTDRIAYSNAAFRVRSALASAAVLAAEEVPECGVEAQGQAQSFVAALTQAAEELVADDSVSADQAAAAGALIQQAADAAPALNEAIDQACA